MSHYSTQKPSTVQTRPESPLTALPLWAVLDSRLSLGSLRLLAYMYFYHDPDTGLVSLSRSEYADALGISDKSRVSKLTSELVILGYIERFYRFDSDGSRLPNAYRLTALPEVKL